MNNTFGFQHFLACWCNRLFTRLTIFTRGRYFKDKNIEGFINRAFKTVSGAGDGKVTYEIRNAGVKPAVVSSEEFEGATFNVTTGDYSVLLKLVCDNLEKAKENAANDEEKGMLEGYIKSFTEVSCRRT